MKTTRKHQRRPRHDASRKARSFKAAPPGVVLKHELSADNSELTSVSGVLEFHPKGYGFLRAAASNFRPAAADAYVPVEVIERFRLQQGNELFGRARPNGSGGPRIEEIHTVDNLSTREYIKSARFDELTPINPNSWLRLQTGPEPLATRVIDLVAPLGKGQRGLIVAPPRSGKTVLLSQIGQAIVANHPEVRVMMLLVDERPEEVTEMRRHIAADVFASNLDHDVESHIRLSRLVIDRAMRLAETGQDIVLLVDSLTRMARAFNKWTGNTGRTMTGGLDIQALDVPKHLFASARAFEEGGSLTILATALVETGSRMDDVIFEEFKGTGNLELVLDRRLADRRVWPAIDINRSGTRREEMLLDAATLSAVTLLRRTLSTMGPVEAMQQLTAQLAKHPSNRTFLDLIARQAA